MTIENFFLQRGKPDSWLLTWLLQEQTLLSANGNHNASISTPSLFSAWAETAKPI